MKLQIAGVLIATSLLAVSCSNDTEDIKLIEKSSAVTLTVTPTVQSRVTTTGTTTTFDSGDNIAVTSTGLANNMSETVLTVGEDGKTLTSTEEFFIKATTRLLSTRGIPLQSKVAPPRPHSPSPQTKALMAPLPLTTS